VFAGWSNDKYTKQELEKWWREIDKALLTVGAKGISASQVNSLGELLNTHERVRVKLASDRQDPLVLSKELASHSVIAAKAELLLVRKRGLMFGRLPGIKGLEKKEKKETSAEYFARRAQEKEEKAEKKKLNGSLKR